MVTTLKYYKGGIVSLLSFLCLWIEWTDRYLSTKVRPISDSAQSALKLTTQSQQCLMYNPKFTCISDIAILNLRYFPSVFEGILWEAQTSETDLQQWFQAVGGPLRRGPQSDWPCPRHSHLQLGMPTSLKMKTECGRRPPHRSDYSLCWWRTIGGSRNSDGEKHMAGAPPSWPGGGVLFDGKAYPKISFFSKALFMEKPYQK